MKNRFIIWVWALVLWSSCPTFGQYNSISDGVAADPVTGRLKRPLNFFRANSNGIWEVLGITNLAELTGTIPPDAYLVRPTLTNATLVGSPTVTRLIILEDPSTLPYNAAINKGYVDGTVAVLAVYLNSAAKLTNALLVAPTLTNANLVGETTVPRLILSDDPESLPSNAAINKGYIDGSLAVLAVYLNSAAKLTNALLVAPTLTNASLAGASTAPRLILTDDPDSLPSNAAIPKGYLDGSLAVLAVYLNSAAKLTNALLVAPTLTNASLVGSTTAPRILLSDAPETLPNNAAVPKGYIDGVAAILSALSDLRFPATVANLAALKALPVSTSAERRATVMASTGGDGAQGDWLWLPTSTGVVTAVCVKSNNLDVGDPGRWFKL